MLELVRAWILIGCQHFYRSSAGSESDSKDIVYLSCCLYSSGVNSAILSNLELELNHYLYSFCP